MGRGAGLEAGDWGGVERVRWGVRGGRVRGTERAGACVEVLGGDAGGVACVGCSRDMAHVDGREPDAGQRGVVGMCVRCAMWGEGPS